MAKNSGAAPTSGKTSSKYSAVMPDGSMLTKKTFHVHSNTAFMYADLHDGKWIASAVTSEPMNWGPDQKYFRATKIS